MTNQNRPARIMERLEDRILFDAVPDGNFLIPEAPEQPLIIQEQLASDSLNSFEHEHRELIVVDSAVSDPNVLISEILASNPNQSFEVRLLTAENSGIEQISAILNGSESYRAVHVLSHGSDGAIRLGNSDFNSSALNIHASEIALWSNALTEDADILLYGCNLAESEAGQSFVDSLSLVTGADVAASNDITGHNDLNGDWELEYNSGLIEASQFSVTNYFNTLNTFTIQANSDAVVNGSGGVGTTGTWSDAGFVDTDSMLDADGDGNLENDQDLFIDVVATVIEVTGTAAVDFETVSTSDSTRDDMRVRVSGDGTATVRWEVFKAGTNDKPTGGALNLTISDIDGSGGPNTVEGVSASLQNLSSYTLQSPTNLQVSIDSDFLMAQGTQNQSDEQPSWVRFDWSTANELVLTYHVYDNGTRFFNHDGDGDLVFTNPDTSFTQGLDLDTNNSSGALGSNYQTTYFDGSIPGIDNDVPVAVADADIQIFDLNDTTLQGATVVLTNASAGDQLNVDTTLLLALGIKANVIDSLPGRIVVDLSGSALIENYETAIKSVTYSNANNSFDQSYVRIVEINATDGNNTTGTASTTINFTTAVNSPTAASDAFVVNEDSTFTVDVQTGLLANDDDPQGDIISIGAAIDSAGNNFAVGMPHILPSGSTITLRDSGSFDFVPAAHYSGVEYFNYTINDTNGNSATAFATINVNPIADQPIISPNYTSTTINEDQISPVLDLNVSSPDADASEEQSIIASGISIGSLLTDGTNSFTGSAIKSTVDISNWNSSQIQFRAPSNSDTDQTITFTVKSTEPNGDSKSTSQTINYTVNAVADAPLVTTTDASSSLDQPIDLSNLIDVALFDTDGSEAITEIVISNIPPTAQLFNNGSLLPISGNSVTILQSQLENLVFQPPAGGIGNYALQISATSTEILPENLVASAVSVTGPVTLNLFVDNVDEAVTTHNDITLVGSGQSVTFDVAANDEVPDGRPLVTRVDGQAIYAGQSISLINGEGSVTLNANGTLTYAPSTSATGTIQFTYSLSDVDGDTDQGTVYASITSPLVDDNATVDEDSTVFIDVLGNDPTASILPATISNQTATNGTYGSTEVKSDGTISYSPGENFNGNDTFTYQVTGLAGGLQYQFFDGLNSWRSLDAIPNLDPSYVGIVNDFDSASLATTLTGSNRDYGVRYFGQVYIESADSYEFSLQSNNGSRIYVDGTLVADNNNSGGTTSDAGNISLSAGYHDIVIEHYDWGGGASLDARMSGSDTNNAATNLFSTGRVGSVVVTQSAAIEVVVNPINDAPIASSIADQNNNDADHLNGFDVSTLFFDLDGDSLSFDDTGTLPPGLAISSSGIISGSIASNASLNSPYTVMIRASDGNGGAVTETFTWSIRNAGPLANDDLFYSNENGLTTGNVIDIDNGSGVDSDPDGDPLYVSTVNGLSTNVGNAVTGSSGGTFTIGANGELQFNPGNDFEYLAVGESTVSSVVYTLSDNQGGFSKATVNVTIRGANDAPTTNGTINTQISSDSENIVPLNVASFFGDPDDNDSLSFDDNGTLPPDLNISGAGLITGTLTSSASNTGPYNVVISASDGNGGSIQQTFNWIVNNPGPTAVLDAISLAEDLSIDVDADSGLLSNDSDIDGDAIAVDQFQFAGVTYSAGSTANLPQGNLTINRDGAYQFVASSDYNGSLPDITYTIEDADGSTTTSTLSIFVIPVNDAPDAKNDDFETFQDTSTAGSLFVNNGNGPDDDVDGDVFTITTVNGTAANIGVSVPGSSGGLFIVNGDGNFVFDPNGDFDFLDSGENSTTSIRYTIADPNGATSTATATITINGINEVIANDDVGYKVVKDEVLSVTTEGVMNNDVDPELSSLPGIKSAISFNGSGGTATSFQNLPGNPTNNDASFEIWVRPASTNSHDTLFETGATGDGLAFTIDRSTLNFEARNTNGANNSIQRVSVDLIDFGVSDPTAEFIQIVGVVDLGGNLDLYVNGTLAASTLASGITDWAGGNGTGLGQNNRGSTISGTGGFVGEFALFRFYESALTAADVQNNFDSIAKTNGAEPVAGATLILDPAQDANAADNSLSSTTSTTFNIALNKSTSSSGLKVIALNGSPANIGSAVVLASGATVTLTETGAFDYDPNGQYDFLTGNATATDSFTYTLSDEDGAIDTATVTITICNDNDAPTANADSVTVDEDGILSGNVLDNDVDPDGDLLSVTEYEIDGVSYFAGDTARLATGDLTLNSNGTYSFDPAANYNGLIPVIEYTVSDGVETATSTLTIAVVAVNDAPQLTIDNNGTVLEDSGSSLIDSGNITFSDADSTDIHVVTSTFNNDAVWSGGNINGAQISALTNGTFAVTNSGWSYSVSNTAVDFLDAGEAVTFSYDITVTDNSGATATMTATISVLGADDNIAISGIATGAVSEDTTLSAQGKLIASDSDTTDNPLSFAAVSDQLGNNGFGNFSIRESGSWIYRLNNSHLSVQGLGAGETLMDSYIFSAVNADGAVETQTVTVTISGADDDIIVSGTTSGLVSEDGKLSTTGSLTATDPDTTDTPIGFTAINNQIGDNGFGSFSINDSGQWTYVLDNLNTDVQALDTGEFLTDSFTFTVTNASGQSATQAVSVAISGTDDAILIGGSTLGLVSEDSILRTAGSLTATDIDVSDNPLFYNVISNQIGDHGFGAFSIDENGDWTYDLDNSQERVQALDSGEVLQDSYTFTVANADGDTETQTVVVSITGADDAIVVGGSDIGFVADGGNLTTTGTLIATDVDMTDNPLIYSPVSNQSGSSGFGSFSINESGEWTYDLDRLNPTIQALDDDEDLSDSFTFTVTNADGDIAIQHVTITIFGADDAIVVGGTTNGEVSEDGQLTATGNLTASDPDTTDNPVSFIQVNNQTSDHGFGKFSIDSNGRWTFELDNGNANVQSLDHEETLRDSFTFIATNADGETESQEISITITGADDAIVVDGKDLGLVAEDGVLVANGVLAATDADLSDNPLSFTAVSNRMGDNGYGEFSINSAGDWTYVLDNLHTNIQALDEGESEFDQYTFIVTNADGASQTKTVRIEISGADDAIVVGGANIGAVQEDRTLRAFGAITASDVDTSDNPLTFSVVDNQLGNAGLGDFSIDALGNWSYELDNNHTSVQSLDDAESLLDSFTFIATNADGDFASQLVSVVISGADDAIVVGGLISGAVQEDGSLTANGTLTVNDIDTTDNPTSYMTIDNQTGQSGYGKFSIDDAGLWTFALENSQPDVQALGTGESIYDSYTFLATNADGATTTQTVTITITGKNDAPEITSNLGNQFNNDGESVTFDASRYFHDVEGDVLDFSAESLPPGLHIDSSGTISGTIESNASSSGPFSVEVSAQDGNGAVAAMNFTWFVENLAPIANANSITIGENSTVFGNVITGDSGSGIDSDPDGDPLSVAAVNGSILNVNRPVSGDNGGEFTVFADGTYSFDPGSDFDSLAAGETQTTQIDYTITDHDGGTAVATVSVNVMGINDSPSKIGEISEQFSTDYSTIATLNTAVFFDDADTNDTLTFDDHGTLPPGLTIDALLGTIGGRLDSDASDDSPYSVTISVDDGKGGTQHQSFQWTVNNIAPNATNNTAHAIEDDLLSFADNVITGDSGAGIDTDPDNDALIIAAINGHEFNGQTTVAGNFGTLTIQSNGNYQFDLNNNAVFIQELSVTDTVQETFQYTLSDEQGGTSTADLVVTIHGSNDSPTAIATVPNQESGEGQDIEIVEVSDFVTDIDFFDHLSYDDGGTLPPGLEIDSSTGSISGKITPGSAESGPFNVTITVTDMQGTSTELNFDWVVGSAYRFDAFNDIAAEDFDDNASFESKAGESKDGFEKRELVFSSRIEELVPEPILAGNATPGTVLVGRIYAADGTLIGEARDTANSAGNWVMNFNDVNPLGQTRIVIEHIATEAVGLGVAEISFGDGTYRSLQLGTSHTDAQTAGSVLSSIPSTVVKEMGLENINPLNLL